MKNRIRLYALILMAATSTLFFVRCGGGDDAASTDPMKNKGIGPVKTVTIGEIDQTMVAEGKEIFDSKCSACHKMESKYIGPALKGVTERRTPEWIMNMILNPEEMLRKDPIAKQLMKEYSAPMANQGINQEEARKMLEYFRTVK
jgi:mono/diheme cytochrome c family protein